MSRRVVAIGECMVELGAVGDGLWRRGFAGDSFNTAWYLRRRLQADWTVSYATCVGVDPVSDEMLAFFERAGVAVDAVRRIGDRTVGLYMIALKDGERSFTYWRSESAARRLASDPAWLVARLGGAEIVYFTGITVAVIPTEDRAAFFEVLRRARGGGATVVFDPNLRLRLWSDAATMRDAVEAAAGLSDLVMPSFEDEAAQFGDGSPTETIARYRALGARGVVVKDGANEVRAWDVEEGEARFAPEPVRVRDSTAAGDSFNAGFLAARLDGRPLAEALAAGARLAGAVVRAPGALVEQAVRAARGRRRRPAPSATGVRRGHGPGG